MNRVGQALLWVGGLGVALVMAYTVALDIGLGNSRPTPGPAEGAVEVAVIYPDRSFWREFHQGLGVCRRRGLVEVLAEGESDVTVRTPAHGRRVRFVYHEGRGLRETRDEVQRLIENPDGPLAVVGSSNTVLTVAIAEALRDGAGRSAGKGGPVLLVPWASSVLTERSEPGEGPVALLDIDPGRTFRFCLNDQYQADLIVRCLMDLDAGHPPRRAIMVRDRYDPYSEDLATCFHRAIERVTPAAEITERSDSLALPLPHDPDALPNPAEEALAEAIWRDASGLPRGQTVWVVLPLQKEPTWRMLLALRRHARRGFRSGASPLRVICGDTIGVESLSRLAGRCPFPLWCVSPTSTRVLGEGVSPDALIPAEIIAALAHCLDTPSDRPSTADTLRDALAGLRLGADDPSALGRSLTFSRSGERVGDDLGHVLMIRPDRGSVFSIGRGPSGDWLEPVALPSEPLASRP